MHKVAGNRQLLSSYRNHLWENGDTVSARFLGGTDALHDLVRPMDVLLFREMAVLTRGATQVKQCASDLVPCLEFKWIDAGEADIRISFDVDDTCWSFIGTGCKSIPDSRASTNMAISDTTDEAMARSVILHELGHAIGLIHEFQYSASGTPWDEDKMHEYYTGSLGWSKDMVDTRIFNEISFESGRSAFDAGSIMQYWLPSSLTINGSTIQPNPWLSDGDRDLIRDAYPISQLLDMGTTRTSNYWKNCKAGGTESVEVKISPAWSPPKVAIGLNMLDTNWSKVRTRALAEPGTAEDSFQVIMHTPGNTTLYNAGVSWLALSTASSRFQAGTFDTASVRAYTDPGNVHAWIKFPCAFSVIPNVFVGLTGFDLDGAWHLRLYASDIIETGFKVNLEGWRGSQLNSAQVQWIAFSPYQSGVCTGHFQGDHNQSWTGSVHFDKSFSRPPKIFTAFTRFDLGNNANFRLDTILDSVETHKMNWRIRNWHDMNAYDVEVAYLALLI